MDGDAKGLKKGALGLVSTIVIGVSSTAPGYSIAASLGFVSAAVGLQAPAVMLLAFIPMACVAFAYKAFNNVDPDCGTNFSWISRSFGPRSGWLSNWNSIVADLVVMPSLAQISGRYLFLLFGADGLADNRFWVAVLGMVFILAMTWICVRGIELSARTQQLLLAAEIVVLVVFAVAALAKVWGSSPEGSVSPSLSWLNPFAIDSWSGFSAGVLIAVFIYWGWDTSVVVNEETKNGRRTNGIAAVTSTVILLGTYVLVSYAAQAFRGPEYLDENSDDVLSAVGALVLGSSWDKFLIIAVLTSAAASCQTTILPASRSALSMAAHRAAPRWLGVIHPRYKTPANNTWLFGILSCAWYALLSLISENVLQDSIASVGLMVALYFGMTGLACAWYFRHQLRSSFRNLVMLGVLPFIGGASLMAVLVKSLIDYTKPENSESGSSWFGLGPPFVIGVGLMVLGIPLMLLCQRADGTFFRRKPDARHEIPHADIGTAPALSGAAL